jgi:hypothetical protein
MSAGGVEVTQRAKDAAARQLGYADWGDFYQANLPILRHGVDLAEAFARFEAETPLPPAVVDALREARDSGQTLLHEMRGKPVGGGDGQTFTMRFPSAATHNRFVRTLSRLTALLDGTDANPRRSGDDT